MKRIWMGLLFVALTTGAMAGVAESVDALIPKLASPNMEERYAPQMELQAMAAQAARPGAEAERAALVKVLLAKAADAAVPSPARVWMVRQIELIGAGESVETLAKLLGDADAEVRECARRALERNPDAAASAALRAALQKGGDAGWRVGLIHALGQRRDAAAVAAIAGQLADKETGAAAAAALGEIADEAAVRALTSAFDGKNLAAAQSLVAAADRRMARGDPAGAKGILEKLLARDAPAPIRAAAMSGMIRADPSQAAKLIPKAVASGEPALQGAAVAAMSGVKDSSLFAALAAQMPKLDPAGRVVVLGLLDASVEPAIVAAAADADAAVRVAALEAMGRVGGAGSVPALLQAAGQKGAEKGIAERALAILTGKGGAEAIEQAAGTGEPESRAAAIRALASRRQVSAAPAMLRYAAEADKAVARAACEALRQVGGDKELAPLAQLAAGNADSDAVKALKSVAERAKDKTAAARVLIGVAQSADVKGRIAMLEGLSVVGGPEALAVAQRCVEGADQELRDGAVRALSDWSDFSAVPVLLGIAANAGASESHNVLALRGIARLIGKAANETAEARAQAAAAAMQAARRDEERKLVLAAAATAPHARSVAMVKEMLAKPEFRTEAAYAAADLAAAMVSVDKAAARELARAAKEAGVEGDALRKANGVLRK